MASVNIRPWFLNYLRDSMIGLIDKAIDKYLNYRFNSVRLPTNEAYEDHWIKIDRRITIFLYSLLFLVLTAATTFLAAMLPTKKN